MFCFCGAADGLGTFDQFSTEPCLKVQLILECEKLQLCFCFVARRLDNNMSIYKGVVQRAQLQLARFQVKEK